jgi:hypothetical protein
VNIASLTVDEIAARYLKLTRFLLERCEYVARIMSRVLDEYIDPAFFQEVAATEGTRLVVVDLERRATDVMGAEYLLLRQTLKSTWDAIVACDAAIDIQLAPSERGRAILADGRVILGEYASVTDGVGHPEGFSAWLTEEERSVN